MCGRFANDAKTDELIREYVADGGKPEDWWKSWAGAYSVARTQDAPIVRDRGEGRILELVRWDWQKPANRPKGGPIVNAGWRRCVYRTKPLSYRFSMRCSTR
ncbi:hypothetical protein [Microbacterium sp. NPDC077057]|uniref:hypothetical protein n=1 Tax=unclassified Microbacterium TaxID=2609290 RepID=UPI003441CB91